MADCTTSAGRLEALQAVLSELDCSLTVSPETLQSFADNSETGAIAISNLYCLLAEKSISAGSIRVGIISQSSTGAYKQFIEASERVLEKGSPFCSNNTGAKPRRPKVIFSPGTKPYYDKKGRCC